MPASASRLEATVTWTPPPVRRSTSQVRTFIPVLALRDVRERLGTDNLVIDAPSPGRSGARTIPPVPSREDELMLTEDDAMTLSDDGPA